MVNLCLSCIFFFLIFTKSMFDQKLGATTVGTTFPDVIVNTVEGCATNRIAGFAQIVHNPRELKTVVDTLSAAEIPSVFADAVLLRREELQQINDIWDFPLAACVPNTCPLPWTVIESVEKAALSNYSREYNIMRNLDFIGRNILRIHLPMVNMLEVNTAVLASATVSGSNTEKYGLLQSAKYTYLGAWYRDLIPRIVKQVSVYPRSNSHELFVYSGYDIYIHNIIFGNERKEMNDLMGGEDKFELCYDPYRVDGSAMGIASYRGVDVFSNYPSQTITNGNVVNGAAYNPTSIAGIQDYYPDLFGLDDTMNFVEFRAAYRKNIWYEAPIAQNYHSRHSIHSRRMVHYPQSIDVPLDCLPFGYSVGSAISTAALAGECGFIRVEIYQDWLSRSFYCTKLSDIPPSYPLPQHKHAAKGNIGFIAEDLQGNTHLRAAGDDDAGWVLPTSVGMKGMNGLTTAGVDENEVYHSQAFSMPGNVLDGGMQFATERVLPSIVDPEQGGAGGPLENGGVVGTTPTYGPSADPGASPIQFNSIGNLYQSTTAQASVLDMLGDVTKANSYAEAFVQPIENLSKAYHNTVSAMFSMKLFQIGFQTLQCVTELLTKLPNIYICTEWNDQEVDLRTSQLNTVNFRITNDLYQLANVFWFIPKDSNGVESMRLYPVHKINHELPIINTMEIKTQLDQGNMVCDWDMLNMVTPSFMGLNPLLENIGIVSFSPEIHANAYPLGYYDPNVSGQIEVTLNTASTSQLALLGASNYSVNMRNGMLKVISLGINGVISCNLNLFRLVF